jgi:hypothetical protein
MSLLSPAPPLLPEASPPERRAALELRRAQLRAAPPEGGLHAPLHPPYQSDTQLLKPTKLRCPKKPGGSNLLDGPDVYWWDHSPELRNYYHLLAFTVFVESATTEPVGSTQYEDYLDSAGRIASQCRLLEEYYVGFAGLGRIQIAGLVESLR